MDFRKWISALVIAAMACGAATHAAEQPAPVYEVTLEGDIEIGPDGNVQHHAFDSGQPEVIEKALARRIQSWKFQPVVVDGHPVIAATRLRVALSARQVDGGDYQLRVEDVWFGEPGGDAKSRQPPRYPTSALRAGMGAKIVLALKLDAQGRVTRVHTEQASLSQPVRSERRAEQWREMFARTSEEAAKRWKFDITESLGGSPVGTSVRIPVTFQFGNPGGARWHALVPGPRHPIPWVTDASVAATDVDGLEDGQVQPLESHFRLESEVVGTLL